MDKDDPAARKKAIRDKFRKLRDSLSIDDIKMIKDNIAKMTKFGVSFIVAGQVIEKLEDTGKK